MGTLLDIGKRAGMALGPGLFTAKGDRIRATASGVAGVAAVPADGKIDVADASQTDGWNTVYAPVLLASGGQQSSLTISDTNEHTLFTSAPTIPARAVAGDVLEFFAAFTLVNNSGGTRTYTLKLKSGSTALMSTTFAPTTSANTRLGYARASIYLTSTSAERTYAEFNLSGAAASPPYASFAAITAQDIQTASASLASAWTFDFTITSNASTATQTVQVDQFHLMHRPIKVV